MIPPNKATKKELEQARELYQYGHTHVGTENYRKALYNNKITEEFESQLIQHIADYIHSVGLKLTLKQYKEELYETFDFLPNNKINKVIYKGEYVNPDGYIVIIKNEYNR